MEMTKLNWWDLVENTLPDQQSIYDLVEARGYLEGWTSAQVVARQALFSLQEAIEFVQAIPWDCKEMGQLEPVLTDLKAATKALLKNKPFWGDGVTTAPFLPIGDRLNQIVEEMADTVIPCFVAAETLGVDLVEVAHEKAARDVARGAEYN